MHLAETKLCSLKFIKYERHKNYQHYTRSKMKRKKFCINAFIKVGEYWVHTCPGFIPSSCIWLNKIDASSILPAKSNRPFTVTVYTIWIQAWYFIHKHKTRCLEENHALILKSHQVKLEAIKNINISKSSHQCVVQKPCLTSLPVVKYQICVCFLIQNNTLYSSGVEHLYSFIKISHTPMHTAYVSFNIRKQQ